MQHIMWRMWLADLVWSFFFVFIFIKGYQNKGWMEGVRYGVYIGLFMNLMASTAQNVFYPIPLHWLLIGLSLIYPTTILGVVTSFIYKPAEQKAA